ncbi:MAG: tripartite tricarboxylate transporter permease [Deltaproteobacteria bacterium]|nr:tripartite tricarboxylate transporter permease [Deltaproteobacteria bacterium]
MDQLMVGIMTIMEPMNFLAVFIGVLGGMIIGAMPGLTAPMGVALLIPFTYGMAPVPAITMLVSLYCGATFGGSIAAILVHAPGTPAAAATTFDGYPLAQKGQAGKALGIACISSGIGGLFSVFVLILLAPVLAEIAIKFGPPEYFALAIFGLSMISSLGSKSVVKNLLGGTIGVFIACVGMDGISGFSRYDFGSTHLMDGISFIPVMIGLFAATEVFRQAEKGIRKVVIDRKISGLLPTWKEIKSVKTTLIRSSLIGTFIGILPAEGGTVASFIGYNEAKRFSKNPEKFGTGCLEGVAAPECANNAATGGAMIPTMALGIPGSGTTAVILGALLVHGMRPGPLLFIQHVNVVYAVFIGMFLANLMFLGLGLGGAKVFSQILRVPNYVLSPIILVLCVVGTYALHNNMADVWIMLICGLVGYKMKEYGFAAAPIVLGLVLGELIEISLRRTLIVFDNNPFVFFTRPWSLAFIILTILGLCSPAIRSWLDNRGQKKAETT